MEVNKINIDKLIGGVIEIHRDKVINALRLSGVNVDDNISDRELFSETMNQLNNAKDDKIIYNLGYVLDETVDLSDVDTSSFGGEDREFFSYSNGFTMNDSDYLDLQDTSKMSSASKQNSWWSQNKGNVFSTGIGVLGNLFGKGKDKTNPPNTGGGNMLQMMQQQQLLANQQDEADRRRREERREKSSQNMMIFGIVGGVVVLGVVLLVVLKKKQ